MIDEQKVFLQSAEMAMHANGAAHFFDAYRYVTKEQTRDMVGYLYAGIKRDIESCPFATREEKDAEIRRRENIMNMLKPLFGL